MKLDFELFNDLGPFDDIHNTLLDAFDAYKIDRTAVTSTLPAEMKEGARGESHITGEQMKVLGPKFAALDLLIFSLVKRCQVDGDEAWEILKRLQAALNKEYGLKLEIERKPISPQEV